MTDLRSHRLSSTGSICGLKSVYRSYFLCVNHSLHRRRSHRTASRSNISGRELVVTNVLDDPPAISLEKRRTILRLHPKQPNLGCNKPFVSAFPAIQILGGQESLTDIGKGEAAARCSLGEEIEGRPHALLRQVLGDRLPDKKCSFARGVSLRFQYCAEVVTVEVHCDEFEVGGNGAQSFAQPFLFCRDVLPLVNFSPGKA